MRTRWGAALVAVAAATLSATGAPAVAQEPLVCIDEADALTSDVDLARAFAGAPATITLERKPGRVATVSSPEVGVEPGGEYASLEPPTVGTAAVHVPRLPEHEGPARIVIRWEQGPEPGVADACRAVDRLVIEVGPSPGSIRRYAADIARAQSVWFSRRRVSDRVFDHLSGRLTGTSVAQVTTQVRTDARVAAGGVRSPV